MRHAILILARYACIALAILVSVAGIIGVSRPIVVDIKKLLWFQATSPFMVLEIKVVDGAFYFEFNRVGLGYFPWWEVAFFLLLMPAIELLFYLRSRHRRRGFPVDGARPEKGS